VVRNRRQCFLATLANRVFPTFGSDHFFEQLKSSFGWCGRFGTRSLTTDVEGSRGREARESICSARYRPVFPTRSPLRRRSSLFAPSAVAWRVADHRCERFEFPHGFACRSCSFRVCVLAVSATVSAAAVIPARRVEALAFAVRLAVFFAVQYRVVETHPVTTVRGLRIPSHRV
jgi:hypothetical protein